MIRPATAADVPEILRLIRALAEYEKLADQVTATEADVHDSLFGPRPVGECLLAIVDGRPVGCAITFRNLSTFIGRPCSYLEDLFVEPAHRGQGLGLALLAAVAARAVQAGHQRLDWSVLDWNRPAIDFYDALGARPLKEWLGYRLSGEALRALAARDGGVPT